MIHRLIGAFALVLLAAACVRPGSAATPSPWQTPWQTLDFNSVRLVAAPAADGAGPRLGLHIRLAPGFKTYWRVPGDGGILAASHLLTDRFVDVGRRFAANDLAGARTAWTPLASLVPLLFTEANPMPIKYCLWRQGLIASPECRLPLTKISDDLARRLDLVLLERRAA